MEYGHTFEILVGQYYRISPLKSFRLVTLRQIMLPVVIGQKLCAG